MYEIEYVKVGKRLATYNTPGVLRAVKEGNVHQTVFKLEDAMLSVLGTIAYVAGGLVKTKVSPFMPKTHGKVI